MHVKVVCENNHHHLSRVRNIAGDAVTYFTDAKTMNDAIERGDVSAELVHCQLFNGTADCRSRSAMRLLNRSVSDDALRAHDLWFEQLRTIQLTKPDVAVLELTSSSSFTV